MTWRIIITDSESLSGVAPVCPRQDDVTVHSTGDGYLVLVDPHGVYDCCPHPHLECWSQYNAQAVLEALNAAESEVCS